MVEDGEYIDLSFFITAWVTPHVSEIDELVRVAAEYHPQKRMVGYQGAETQEEQTWVSSDQVETITNAKEAIAGHIEASRTLGKQISIEVPVKVPIEVRATS